MCQILNIFFRTFVKTSAIFGIAYYAYRALIPKDRLWIFFGTIFVVILLLDMFVNLLFASLTTETFRIERECRVTPHTIGLAYAHKYGRRIMERNDLTLDEKHIMLHKQLLEDMRRLKLKKPSGYTDTKALADIAKQLKLFDYDGYERGVSWADNSAAGRTFYPKSDVF